MTTKRFLIDLTDQRFFTPENTDVIELIRRVNPFAHSDVGMIVFDCARAIEGVGAYRPSPASRAPVQMPACDWMARAYADGSAADA